MKKRIDLKKDRWQFVHYGSQESQNAIRWINKEIGGKYDGAKGYFYGSVGGKANMSRYSFAENTISPFDFTKLSTEWNPNVGETIQGSNDDIGWGNGIYLGSVGCNFGYAHVIKLEDGTIYAVQHIRKLPIVVTLTINGVPTDIKTLSDSELLALKNS